MRAIAISLLVVFTIATVNAAKDATGGGAGVATSDEAEGVFAYTIEQSFVGGSGGDSEFSARSSVELNFPQLMRDRRSAADLDDSDSAPPQQRRTAGAGVSSAADDKRNAQSVKFEAFEFDTEQIAQLKRTAERGGYYRIRLVPKKGGSVTPSTAAVLNRASGEPITASIRACQLLVSNFRELWTFQSDVYGHITSIDYTTPITACPDSIASLKPKSGAVTPRGKITFGRSGERVRAGRAGVAMPTGPGVVDPEAAAAAEAAAKTAASNKPEEKSFFAKYWMYIVPFALMMMFQGGAAGQADGQAAAAARHRD